MWQCAAKLIPTVFFWGGVSAAYCYTACYGNTRMVRLPESEKSLMICYSRFDGIPACDGRTDGHLATA